jgi:hypothetical protein
LRVVFWCGNKALKEAFSDLYGIACARDASVAAHLEFSGGFNECNISFVRLAHDRAVDVFASFFSLLYLGETW